MLDNDELAFHPGMAVTLLQVREGFRSKPKKAINLAQEIIMVILIISLDVESIIIY